MKKDRKQHNTSLTDLTSCRRNTSLTGVLNRLDRLVDLVNNTHSIGKACFSKQSDIIQDYKYNKAEIDCMTQGLHKELKHA
jgi:hypothetical protein